MVYPDLRSIGSRFSLFVVAAVLAIFSPSVLAQTTVQTGSIVGTVTDPSGAAVPNAKIVITNTNTGQNTTLMSNAAGVYNSGALVPGQYKVQASAKGFSTTSEVLTVLVSNTANGDVHLQVGQESTVVEVQASEVQVNTEQATVQGVLSATQIENLPVNGRNFLDLAQLEPGVQIQSGENFDPTKVGYSSISFGSRFGLTARIAVDGVDVSDETVGTTTEDIPASGIQEF
ncbi:MAG TPA: carboxypeptidase-like regulatory domain-containing protein, partial [Candidatus Sulfotelmatobacter sp.]|nr:carboxypeptidase-like regulatory domain-containing protein [Candidatus Sulfotelmatobacter sp.]